MTVVYEGLPPLFLVVIGGLFCGLLASIPPYRRAPSRRGFAVIITVAVALAATSGLYAAAAYNAYQLNNTYHFGYYLAIEGNGTDPESVIVPVPEDESLLAGLARTSGTVNWSLVDTAHGRGLFVQFAGGAILQAHVTIPPSAAPPNTAPTMEVISNCTATPSNCTGLPQLWMFYSGSAGVYVTLSIGYTYLGAYPRSGWAGYDVLMAPVP